MGIKETQKPTREFRPLFERAMTGGKFPSGVAIVRVNGDAGTAAGVQHTPLGRVGVPAS